MAVVTFLDASFAKETKGRSQQGMFQVATTTNALEGKTTANQIETNSSKISRVVKSTMAAESCSLGTAVDRQLYVRLLFQVCMYGEENMDKDWRLGLRVPGYLVTDARSLYDHLTTTGSLPAERQTMLDLLSAKELIEAGVIHIRWVPTQHQLADHLTKQMSCELLKKFKEDQQVALVQSKEEAKVEKHKSELRRAQRQRRKVRMKQVNENSSPNIKQIGYVF